MNSIAKIVALVIVATGLAGAPTVFAQNQTDQTPQAEAPAMNPDEMEGMMQGGMMGMMTQMNEMMGACTKMMQAMTPDERTPDEGEEPGNPG